MVDSHQVSENLHLSEYLPNANPVFKRTVAIYNIVTHCLQRKDACCKRGRVLVIDSSYGTHMCAPIYSYTIKLLLSRIVAPCETS